MNQAIDTTNPNIAAVIKAGNLKDAADALDISKGALQKRLQRLGLTLAAVLAASDSPAPQADVQAPQADAKPDVPAPKAPKAAAPKADTKADTGEVERYVRKGGSVTVLKGKSRLMKVDADHPAAQAITLNEELGGKSKPSPSGLKLLDSEGRCFAIVNTTKATAAFYVQKVDHDTAAKVAKDAPGEWSYCWPNRKEGCAVLRGVEKTTKGLLRTLMKLHASHALDRRTKEARAAA